MAQTGSKWSCPCGILNQASWDVCVSCGELRPVVRPDSQGVPRSMPRRARARRGLEDPLIALVGVVLCFVSGGLIAFAVRPASPARTQAAQPVEAVAVDATATAGAGAPAWVPVAAAPPSITSFRVAPPVASPPAAAPLPGFQFSAPAERTPPPVGLYAPPADTTLPRLQPASPPAAPGPPPQFVTAQQIVARVRASTLRIVTEAPAADRRGTGFVVGPRLMVTCAHLVQGTSAIGVARPDGQFLRARVERLDTLNDLAVLSTQGDLPPPLPLDPSGRVEPGEPIAITGFPSDPENAGSVTDFTSAGTLRGWVTRNSPTGERVQLLQILADVRPGHSGGPVYSLRDGRVMGVVSFRVVGETVSGFAAGIPMLQQLLQSGEPTRDPISTLEGTP